ncbi:kinase-like domain-containing protein [Ephemerocybe angulata]|uniref:Kinase-like domain-containing protein n=1 Tax=Ephemerocybe angulata TaxID=980116 RepID=A0A8H6HXV7_9AGAR|nr:kinase-like domain-containing protein [Tulosesus angulatus]
MSSTIPITVCHDDNGGGCGGDFARKSAPGLCYKCAKLSTLEEGSELFAQWMNFKQCVGCGLAMRHLLGPSCGSCTKHDGRASGGHTHRDYAPRIALQASQDTRAHAMDTRMSKHPAPAFAPGGPLAGSGTGSGGKLNNVAIGFVCPLQAAKKGTSGLSGDFGQWYMTFSRHEQMADVLKEVLEALNKQWSRKHGMDLENTEVELRLAGNKAFIPGTENGSVGEICTQYLSGPLSAQYGQVTKVKAPAGKHAGSAASYAQATLHLEVYIDQVAVSIEAAASTYAQGRKRAGTQLVMEDSALRQKRAALGMFLRPSSGRYMSTERGKSLSITIQKAVSVCSRDSGEVSVSWPENGSQVPAIIHSSVFASGHTKVMTIDLEEQLYVAKRVVNAGPGGNIITARENEMFLEMELIRVKVLNYFLQQFLEEAHTQGIEHYRDIVVTDAILVREIGAPSEVSSFPPGDVDGAVWLVESKRARSIIKFCGTMGHPSKSDKMALTVQALLHFIYEKSGGAKVYADMQGTKAIIDGREKLVLFDPMSHTPKSKSGLGDQGKTGILAFVSQHECDYVCISLGLSPLDADDVNISDSETEEDEGEKDE